MSFSDPETAIRPPSIENNSGSELLPATASKRAHHHQDASDALDRQVVLEACSSVGYHKDSRGLHYVSRGLTKNDRESHLAACSQDGWVLQYSSRRALRKKKAWARQNDKEVVLKGISKRGAAHVFSFTSEEMRGDKQVAMAACSQDGNALQHVSEELKNDTEVVLAACSQNGHALQYASRALQNDKKVVLEAISKWGAALVYTFISEELKGDKQVAMAACSQDGNALQYVSEELKNNKDVVLAACSQCGWALRHASKELRNDKDFVLSVCSKNGDALAFPSESLRADKEVVMAAVESKPESLKHALEGLNQDEDCLIMAGLWDEGYKESDNANKSNKKKIVLSTRFSLSAESSEHATQFTLELKKQQYIQNGGYVVYSPNAFNKSTCDPNWTDKDWPCRGTFASCQKPPEYKIGVPCSESCWRYSFRFQLEEAHRLGGFMIQVVDLVIGDSETAVHELGDGQKIETEMAKDVGIKTFRFFQPLRFTDAAIHAREENAFTFDDAAIYAGEVNELVSKIEEWHKSGRINMGLMEHGKKLNHGSANGMETLASSSIAAVDGIGAVLTEFHRPHS